MITISCREKKFFNIKAIIFDKDGTLQDSQNFLRELGQKRARLIDAKIPGIGEPLLMAFGIHENKLDEAGLMATGSRIENEIAAAAYIAETGRGWFESKEIAVNAFKEADGYLKDRTSHSPIFEDTYSTIKTLATSGVLLGILSADTTTSVNTFVLKHGLSEYIQLTMGVDNSQLTKPDPRLFIAACEALGVEVKSTLMVGDAQGDIEMASNAGAAGTIGICRHSDRGNYLHKADVVINNLKEIQILKN